MKQAEEIEDQMANLLAQLIILHGVDRAEEFVRTIMLQFAAARGDVSVVRFPPRLHLVQ